MIPNVSNVLTLHVFGMFELGIHILLLVTDLLAPGLNSQLGAKLRDLI